MLEVDDEGHREGNRDGDGTSMTTPAGHVGVGARDKTATRTPGEGEGEGENDDDDDGHTTPQLPPRATARRQAGTGRREPRTTPPHPHALHEGRDFFYLLFLLIYLCRPSRICVRGRLFYVYNNAVSSLAFAQERLIKYIFEQFITNCPHLSKKDKNKI